MDLFFESVMNTPRKRNRVAGNLIGRPAKMPLTSGVLLYSYPNTLSRPNTLVTDA